MLTSLASFYQSWLYTNVSFLAHSISLFSAFLFLRVERIRTFRFLVMRRTPRNSFIYFFLVSTVCHFSSYASFLPLHPPLSILRCRPNKLPLAYGTPASRSQRPSVAAALFPPANDTGCLLTRHRAQVIAHFLSLSLPFSLCLLAFLLLRTSCGVPKPMT